MSPWKATRPKDDRGYFERMTTRIFSAGLNWQVVEKKRAGFQKAFSGFMPEMVARYAEKDVKRLVSDAEIVRNERKIRSTIYNAGEFERIKKEYGSFRNYLNSFGKRE